MEFKLRVFDELTNRELYEILKLRSEIFLVEQNITCLDTDGIDYESLHCFIEEDKKIIAYLRAFDKEDEPKTVRIGRVVTARHGAGHGKLLFDKAIPAIKKAMGCSKLYIHAQKQAKGFYEKCGFYAVGGEFIEDGIVHIEMIADI